MISALRVLRHRTGEQVEAKRDEASLDDADASYRSNALTREGGFSLYVTRLPSAISRYLEDMSNDRVLVSDELAIDLLKFLEAFAAAGNVGAVIFQFGDVVQSSSRFRRVDAANSAEVGPKSLRCIVEEHVEHWIFPLINNECSAGEERIAISHQPNRSAAFQRRRTLHLLLLLVLLLVALSIAWIVFGHHLVSSRVARMQVQSVYVGNESEENEREWRPGE